MGEVVLRLTDGVGWGSSPGNATAFEGNPGAAGAIARARLLLTFGFRGLREQAFDLTSALKSMPECQDVNKILC